MAANPRAAAPRSTPSCAPGWRSIRPRGRRAPASWSSGSTRRSARPGPSNRAARGRPLIARCVAPPWSPRPPIAVAVAVSGGGRRRGRRRRRRWSRPARSAPGPSGWPSATADLGRQPRRRRARAACAATARSPAKPPIPLPEPRAVAVGLGSVWVVNGESLYKLDPDEGKPTEIEVGDGPGRRRRRQRLRLGRERGRRHGHPDRPVRRRTPTETIEVGRRAARDRLRRRATSGWRRRATARSSGSAPTRRRVTRTVEVGTEADLARDRVELGLGRRQPRRACCAGSTSRPNEVAGSPIEVAPKPRGGRRRLRARSGSRAAARGVVERFDPETGEPGSATRSRSARDLLRSGRPRDRRGGRLHGQLRRRDRHAGSSPSG